MTSNPQNDQDNDFLTDRLRERMQTEIDTYFGAWSAQTAEQRREDADLQRLAADRLAAVDRLRAQARELDAALHGLGLPPVERSTVTRKPGASDDGDDEDRR